MIEMLGGTNVIEYDEDKAELNLMENSFNDDEDGVGGDEDDKN